MRTATRQKMAAKLIAASAVLQMSSAELQRKVEEELTANPALEMADDALCPHCQTPLEAGRCRNCGPRDLAVTVDSAPAEPSYDLPWEPSRRAPDDEGGDLYSRIEAPTTLQDHLRVQARMALRRDDHAIADYLISNITDEGHLDCHVEDAALHAGVPAWRAERVLKTIQRLDPTGVGGRDLAECLLIQLEQVEEEGISQPHVRRIITDHWKDLIHHGYLKIARSLRIPPEQVQEALDFMRHHLNPYPGRQFQEYRRALPSAPEKMGRPDVVIHRRLDQYLVEVPDPTEYGLRVSGSYRELCQEAFRDRARYLRADWEQAQHYVERAQWFIHSIRKRRETIREITQRVVEIQHAFLDTGADESLAPLTRARVAALVGKHESTVSRATSGKLVLLPSGRMIKFQKFFAPAQAIKSVIEDLVGRESPDAPLTDDQICRALGMRGHHIARRTVAKYRLALRIPSSEQRRKMRVGRSAA